MSAETDLHCRMVKVATKLEALGAKHAPFQCCTEPPHTPDGRYITLRDPPGVYYILGTDNENRRTKLADEVQIIFFRVPREQIGRYAVAIGYRVKSCEPLDSPEGPIPSAILEPL